MEIRKLNMLRGMAALIVVSHFSNSTKMLGGVLGNGAGQLGVMLFFVLSGFLISHLYMGRDFSKGNIVRFAWARIARVLPLFLLVVLASYLLWIIGLRDILYPIKNTKILLSHLLLLSGVSVLWTIPPEIQFYILFVPLWWLYSRKKIYLFALIILMVIALTLMGFPSPETRLKGLIIRITLFSSLPLFLLGVFFGRLYNIWSAPAYLRKNAFISVLVILPLCFPEVSKLLHRTPFVMWEDIGPFLAIGLVFFVMIFFVPDDNILLANPVGDFLGKVSYSLYMLHLPILWLIEKPARHAPAIYFWISLALIIVVAYVSYAIIEVPSRKALRALGAIDKTLAKPTSPSVAVDA